MSVDSEEVNNISCFICDKDLECDSDKVVIVKRGIETLKSVSLERKDERHKMLLHCNAIKVHKECRQKYILKRAGKFTFNFNPPNVHAWKYSPAKKKGSQIK